MFSYLSLLNVYRYSHFNFVNDINSILDGDLGGQYWFTLTITVTETLVISNIRNDFEKMSNIKSLRYFVCYKNVNKFF